MADQQQIIPVAVKKAGDDLFVMGSADVGGLTGAILGAVAVLAFVFSKLRKMGKIDGAEGDLYESISEENKRLVERIKMLESTKDDCQKDLANIRGELSALKGQLTQIGALEKENIHLRERLDEKDRQLEQKNRQIEEMIQSLMAKDGHILELTKRVHNLELRLSADEKKFCADCPRVLGAV